MDRNLDLRPIGDSQFAGFLSIIFKTLHNLTLPCTSMLFTPTAANTYPITSQLLYSLLPMFFQMPKLPQLSSHFPFNSTILILSVEPVLLQRCLRISLRSAGHGRCCEESPNLASESVSSTLTRYGLFRLENRNAV